ncbi:MAG: VTT domain-containing protein [bacterium]
MEILRDFFDLLINSDKLIRVGGLALLLLIVYLETGVFFGFIFAGDALLFSAGLLCGTTLLDIHIFLLLPSLTAAAIAGNLTGYYTGKVLGKKLFTRDDSWFFKKRHMEKTRIFYQKYGGVSLIAGRFVWIVRTFVPILAGASDMSFRRFNFFNVTGAFLWVWTIVPLGYLTGRLIPKASEHILWFVSGITLIALIVLIRGIYKVLRQR